MGKIIAIANQKGGVGKTTVSSNIGLALTKFGFNVTVLDSDNVIEVAKKFLGLGTVDYIIDGGKSKSKIATTIVDCTTDEIKFLRIGKITEDEIRNYLAIEEAEGGSSE